MAKGRLIFFAVLSYVKVYTEEEIEHLEVHREKTQGNEYKVQDGKLVTYYNFLTVVKHWNRFPRETAEPPSFELLKLSWTWP